MSVEMTDKISEEQRPRGLEGLKDQTGEHQAALKGEMSDSQKLSSDLMDLSNTKRERDVLEKQLKEQQKAKANVFVIKNISRNLNAKKEEYEKKLSEKTPEIRGIYDREKKNMTLILRGRTLLNMMEHEIEVDVDPEEKRFIQEQLAKSSAKAKSILSREDINKTIGRIIGVTKKSQTSPLTAPKPEQETSTG